MNPVNNKKSVMTHIVLGYPDFKSNKKLIKVMSDSGVDYIEMQIPFSDPIADGPTIMNANQFSLKQGVSLSDCFDFAGEMTQSYKNINFLFMSYYNILFNYSVDKFIKKAKNVNIYGLIIPDILFDEDKENFFPVCRENKVHPICLFSPTTTDERLKKIRGLSSGFVYCTSRIGITGADKNPSKFLENYIRKARRIIDIPIAVGFGIDSPEKAGKISAFADIIIIGSKIINIVNESGKYFQQNVRRFLLDIKKAI
jgi:tryptophan synthase alpha chain